MPVLTCNACNKEFHDDDEQKLHYKSDWHRYNLKRKIAGVPGVTEALFFTKQEAVAQERNKQNETPMLYSCGLCSKGYRSSKAYDQHVKSKTHLMRLSQSTIQLDEEKAIIKPLPPRPTLKPPSQAVGYDEESAESEDEWVEVDSGELMLGEATKSLNEMSVDEDGHVNEMETSGDSEEVEALDPSCCFMCDLEHDTIESCMVHMHKQHGFFIPDVEYLKDPEGLLTYLGLKVKKDFMCLYCNERCHPFSSLEAVRKHMAAKGHCKVHYGDGGEDEEPELEEFYDYTCSYVDEGGKELVAVGDSGNTIELTAGSELFITKRTDHGVSTKTFGSREYMRYYRQKPRPSAMNNPVIASLATRYRSMGLVTVQSREQFIRMKVMKQMNRSGVEAMRTKMGMKSNVIRNLPKNVTY